MVQYAERDVTLVLARSALSQGGSAHPTIMSIFDAYAPFYDSSGQIRFAILMGQYLREVLAQHAVTGRRALDLACGTGTLALMLVDAGWRVVGLDQSRAMRERAQAKIDGTDIANRISIVSGDMRDPLASGAEVGEGSFDLVTCTYDSLNYLLTEAELAGCFAGVARALRPGGLFFADMNTRDFLEFGWGVYEVLEQPGFVQITQSYFDPANACSTMVLTGFVGDDTYGYQRFDETHIERAYEPDLVATLLTTAGLQVEAAYDCFTFQPAHARSQRIAWVARKPGA